MVLAYSQRPVDIPQTELAPFSGHRPVLTVNRNLSAFLGLEK